MNPWVTTGLWCPQVTEGHKVRRDLPLPHPTEHLALAALMHYGC